jgi:hypothetical protein
MEFQSGPDAQLKPVKLLRFKKLLLKVMLLLIIKVQPSFSSWSLQLADEQGKIQSFGPYTQDVVSIPGKSILGSRQKEITE